jgi:serine O-acetyltransferase
MIVPSGLGAIRADLQTWFRETGAVRPGQKLKVVLQSPPLWALAFYRWGRWIRYPAAPRPRALTLAMWAVYRVLWTPLTWLTRVFLTVHSELGPDVFIHAHDSVWIAPSTRIGRGSRLYGGNTLGLGGRGDRRGAPNLGERVVLGPGVVLVGLMQVPDGAVLGANASAARDVPGAGGWTGAPPQPWTRRASDLVPSLRSGG